MAEKGILVADASSGESIACRDGYENDDDSNARIVQLVDQSQRQHDISWGSGGTPPVREFYSSDSSDGTDLSTTPADILNNALTCGDKTTLVISAKYAVASDAEIITVTPIVIGANDYALGFLTPKTISSFKPDGGTAITKAFHRLSGPDPVNLIEILTWNVLGAYKVGLHVATNTADGTFSGSLDIYAKMISGPSFDIPAASRPTAGSYTSEAYSSGG